MHRRFGTGDRGGGFGLGGWVEVVVSVDARSAYALFMITE